MIELVYPVDFQAPLLPEPTAAQLTRNKIRSAGTEYFPIITEEGNVVAMAERAYCHSGSHLLHPVVHLHLIDADKRIYLQKRSIKKKLLPGRWDTAVGGHVIYGESITEALFRESSEELGLEDFNPIFLESYRWDTDRDAEFVNVFASIGAKTPVPDGDEVEQGRWWTLDEIENTIGTGVFTPNFESEFIREKKRLIALL